MSLGSRVSCSSSRCACVLPDGTTCDFHRKRRKTAGDTDAEISLHAVTAGQSDRYQCLSMVLSDSCRDIKRSTSHQNYTSAWSLWQTSRLIQGLERSIRHHLWSVRRVPSCHRLCQHFLNAYDLISATLLAQILRSWECIHERVGSWCSARRSRSTSQNFGAEGRSLRNCIWRTALRFENSRQPRLSHIWYHRRMNWYRRPWTQPRPTQILSKRGQQNQQ